MYCHKCFELQTQIISHTKQLERYSDIKMDTIARKRMSAKQLYEAEFQKKKNGELKPKDDLSLLRKIKISAHNYVFSL